MGFDNECILNIQSLPGEYFCPVCRTLVYPSEALQAQCTHLYCKQCLAYVVATTHACPYDGYLVTEADSKPLIESNKSVADAINMIQVHCLYHRSGCQWQGSLLECITHCTSCNFGNSPVVCNRCGTQIVHRQVQEHAQICPGVQPQAQQTEVAPTQASAEQSQAGAQAASQTSQDPSLQNAAASAATSASISVSAPASSPAVASATTAVPAAISGQGNSSTQPQAANTGLTPEQWYQQQQLQYQQYYQQYPGYYPYQQQAQYAQQAYPQYSQPQMQTQTQVMQAPQQPLPYQQSQPQILPQPQPLPQPQAQQVAAAQPATQVQLYGQAQPQSFPQGNPQPHPYGHIPQMQVPANPQQQLPTPVQQSQPQANPPSQLQVPSQSVGHHPPTQPSQVQPSVPLQHQQLVMPHQHGPPQMPQPQSHAQHQPQTHPHVHPRPQLHQLPHMQSQQHPQPPTQPQPQGQQPMHQPPQPQHPAVHAVTGHQSYPQSQPPQQMLPVAQQQRPAYVHPQQQQLPQHPAQMQALLPPQQPQMRPPQSAVPVQAQATMPPPRMGYHPNLTPVQQHPQHHPGVQPPAHHGVPHQPAMGQMHPQHGPFPSQQAGLPPQTLRPQGSLHTQPYAPPQSHVQQNAILTQGAPIHETQPGGGRAEITIHALPSGGQAGSLQPNDSRVQKTDRTESLPDKTSDVKESRSTVVMSELSGMRESEFKPKGNIDNGADDGHDSTTVAAGASVRVKENESLEPFVDQTVKGDKQSEQSAVVTVNNLSDRNSQRMVKAEEEGREEKSISGMNEGEENEKVKLPAIGNSQPLSKDSEVAVQKISPFPVKGEHRALPTDKASGLPGPISDRYQNQMIPHGPPDMRHMPSHRLRDSDRMLPQHMPPFGPDHDRSFQGPQYQMQVHGHSHMRPPGGFAENLPPQGQPLGPASFRPEVPPVGFPESGLHRGPGQFGPSSKTLESPGMTSQLPPHGQLPPPRMPHAGPLPGPPFGGPPSGSFDNPGNILAKAPTNAEGSIGMSRPPYPMPDDKFSNRMPGSYDSRFIDSRQPIPPMDLLSGPPRSMVKLNGPLGNIPEPTHGSADRFQGPPEGLKPLLDDRFKSFASDSNRYNTDRRNFEEDSKQFPRHAGLDGEGYPKMENYSSRPQDRILNAWGPERPAQPFGHDGGPKFDSSGTAMASRFRPPHLSDGVFGDWSHHGDTSRQSDFGRYNSDNPPFGMPGRDNIDLPPSRFESNTVFHGPSSQSRFKDFDGGDPHVFGERSRPFNIHSDPLGNSVQGSRLPMSSAPFGDSERSRMIEQYGSAQPRFGEVDGPDFMHGNPAGELFGARMPILGPGSPRGFRNDSLHLGNLPLHLRNKDPGFGGNFQSNVFSSESGLFNSVAFQDDMRSSDPLRKRKPGGAGWCRICKIDCETVEGLDLHSQTREHQKMAMDIVLRIKKNNSKKQKMSSEENNPLDDANKANKTGFESRGNKH